MIDRFALLAAAGLVLNSVFWGGILAFLAIWWIGP